MHDTGLNTHPGVTPSHEGEHPTDARRRLCVSAMAGATGLLRYAARFSPTMEDAEDAYQRGMEIALTRGPTGDLQQFIAWLQVVIRNEATSISRRRVHESPAGEGVITNAIDSRTAADSAPDAVAEWRERYRTLQDAMTSLSDAERVCLLLRTAGVSRAEIRALTGFTDRKVERCIVQGRQRLNAWHIDLSSGERCARIRPALEHVADREATGSERRSVSRHVRHCGICRSTLRARRESNAGLVILVPVALMGTAMLGAAVPDPSAATMGLMERGTARATVTVGSAWQSLLDLPQLMSAKVGVSALALTIAGVAGVPVVAQNMRGPDPPTAQVSQAMPTTADSSVPLITTTAPAPLVSYPPSPDPAVAARARAKRQQQARARSAHRQAAAQATQARKASRAASAPPVDSPPPSAAPQASPAPASPESQPQTEFGP